MCVSAWRGCVCARICESECACKLHCSAGFDVFLHTAVAADLIRVNVCVCMCVCVPLDIQCNFFASAYFHAAAASAAAA